MATPGSSVAQERRFKKYRKERGGVVLVVFAKCIEIWPLKNTFGIKLSLL